MEALGLVAIRRFETIEIPEPTVGPRDALVRVAAMTICGSDLTAYVGGHTKITLPTVLGHEFAGVVERVGADVTRVRPGDRVAADPTFGCGTCRLCRAGLKNVCPQYRVMGVNLGLPGAMARLVSMPEDHLHPIPGHLSLAEAAMFQPLSVSYHAAVHQGGIQAGETALVLGAGPIGLGVLMAAKGAGATVIVSDPIPYRREAARSFGADGVIDPVAESLQDAVAGLGDGLGVDVAYEAVGGRRDELLLDAVRAVRPRGRVVVIGMKMPEARIPVHDLKALEKSVLGSQAHPDSFPPVIDQVASGILPASRLISHRIPMADGSRAFELLESRDEGVMKIVLVGEEAGPDTRA